MAGRLLYASGFMLALTGSPDQSVASFRWILSEATPEKKDAPSGTAISLAEQILANIGRKDNWINDQAAAPNQLHIHSERIDPAPGTHQVKYSSTIDDIEIIHTAHTRKGFASGAVLAAEFANKKSGIFTMKDVLK